MNCFLCHTSFWMLEKSLNFMKNLIDNLQEDIRDSDVFSSLDCDGAEALLARLVHENFPKNIIKKMSRNRDEGFQLELDRDRAHTSLYGLWNNKEIRKNVLGILPKMIEHVLATSSAEKGKNDIFKTRVQEFQQTLKLTDEEVDIFLCVLAWEEDFLNNPECSHCNTKITILAKAMNLSETAFLKKIFSHGALYRFHCLDSDLDINGELYDFLNGINEAPLASSYYQKDASNVLPWSDFAELTQNHGSILKRMLTASNKPVNILLYGTPGTGKTSFAKTLVREIGKTCYNISQNVNGRGGRCCSSPDFRFGALQICDQQIDSRTGVIIVDEADQMLSGDVATQEHVENGGKGLLNVVMDTLNTSVIWIANTPAWSLDESSRRRFDYSICFKPLDCEQRKCIWKNNLRRLKMERLFTASQIDEYAEKYPISAGGISQTLENLKKMQPKKQEVSQLLEQLMKPHCELMGVMLANDKQVFNQDYSLEGLNIQGDVKLERIIEAVRGFLTTKGQQDPDRPRMNLLLTGAPGTGKTEFVKYLGDVLATKVNVCMGSDLLGPLVGETEQKIACAFKRAEAEHAILFLDEIDGMVQNRANARNNWEVTQVNELLHQMENFNGIMIGATNFLQKLDPAVMRRFTFKLQFDYLDNKGKQIFFQRMFHATLTEVEQQRLDDIPDLAPGDFRTVRQSLYYYGDEVTNAQRLEALEQESRFKNNGETVEKRHIGF